MRLLKRWLHCVLVRCRCSVFGPCVMWHSPCPPVFRCVWLNGWAELLGNQVCCCGAHGSQVCWLARSSSDGKSQQSSVHAGGMNIATTLSSKWRCHSVRIGRHTLEIS